MPRPTWEFKINFGNILVLVGMLVSVVVWYGMVSAHLSDSGMHNSLTPQERQQIIREEVNLQLEPTRTAIVDMRSSMVDLTNAVRQLQITTARVEETVRLQHDRIKEESFRNWVDNRDKSDANDRLKRGGVNERP